MARAKKRGISAGTVFMLVFSLCTLLAAGVVYLRISGDAAYIRLDSALLSEPLREMAGVPVSDAGESPQPSLPAPASATDAPMQSPTASPTPTATPRQPVTLLAAGQIALGSQLRESGLDAAGAYRYDDIFSPVASTLSGADVSLVTLRTGLGEENFGNYLAPSALARSLSAAGVDLANLGTDRLLDGGVAGMSATVAALTGAQITGVGALREPTLVEAGGLCLGFVSYVDSLSSAGQAAASEAEIAAAVRMLDVQTVQSDIAQIREQGADVVVVLVYWGSRSDTAPSDATRQTADALARSGADVILGVGPTSVHALERKSVVSADGYVREVFIAYSLGNFLIDDSRETRDITGLMLSLTFEWDEANQCARISDAWYMPTWIMRWRDEAGAYRFRVVPAGASSRPENMTESIYQNMQGAYESLVNRLGDDAARPVAQ